MNRALLTLCGGVLLLLGAGIAGLSWLSLRAGKLGDRLVEEANRQARAPWPRPAHVEPPTPGSFGKVLEGLMPEVARLHKASDAGVLEKDKQCLPVEQGLAPFDTLAEPCRLLLESRRQVLPQVLAATRAETGGLPPGVHAFSGQQPHLPKSGMAALRNLPRLAGLKVRRLLARGERGAAVDTCLDGLALSRELALGGALPGLILSSKGIEELYHPCAGALDAAPAERKRQALGQLARLREGFPAFSSVMRSEAVLTQLTYYGHLLSEEQLEALDPGVRALTRESMGGEMLPGPRLLARRHWHATVKAFEVLQAAADLPSDARHKAFTRFGSTLSRRWFEVPPEDAGRYDSYAARADRRRLLLEVLSTLAEVDLARAEQGHWPTTLPPGTVTPLALEAASLTEVHLKPSEPTLEGYAVRLTADTPPPP